MTNDPADRPVFRFAGPSEDEPKRGDGWLKYRSAPYAWERYLMWLILVACFGANVGREIGSGLAWIQHALP